MTPSELPTFEYRVDPADCLQWVDSWWLAFARENGAETLTEAAVLGRRLWDFVADDETCRLYQEVHRRVRASGKPAVLPFRCDTALVLRHMRLTITREEEGRLHYESVLLRAEPRRFQNLLHPTAPRSDGVLTMCSCCKRSLVETEGWLEIEEVAVKLRVFEEARPPRLRYSVCPTCASHVHTSLSNGGAA